jgi:diguanylate cyclase (GGDEF)-like protein/PAS domain S-box-containing protein
LPFLFLEGMEEKTKEQLLGEIQSLQTKISELERTVNKHKEIQEALCDCEEQYRTLVKNVNIGVYRNTGDPQGRFLQANPAIAKMFGYESVEEFMQIPVSDLYQDPEDRKPFVSELLEKGFVKGKELRLRKKDGTPIWSSCTAKVQYNGNGGIKWIDGVIEDITERKRAEEALRESEEKCRTLLDSAIDGILVADIDTRQFFLGNRMICEILGYSKEEIQNLTINDIHPLEDLPYIIGEFEKIARGEITLTEDIPVKRKDGSIFYVDINASTINLNGRRYLLAIFRDITERKSANEEIRKFKTISDAASHGSIITSLEGNVVYANAALAQMHGYTVEELIGKHFSILHAPEQMVFVNKLLNEKLKKEGSFVEEIWHKRKDGSLFPVLINATLIKDGKGSPLFISATVIDISERKRAEKELQALNKQLLKSNRRFKQLALIDSQTGLYNHRYLREIIEKEFHRARRYAHPISVIMFDIDYFKSINDVYGHLFGDLVLKQFTNQLKKMVRGYDTLVRFGGEEFLLISPGTDRPTALALAQRILDAITLYNFGTKKHSVKLKLSLAVASFPEDRISKGADLLDLVDKILNKVKVDGGDKVYSSADIVKEDTPNAKKVKETRDTQLLKDKMEKLTKRANQGLIEAVFAFAKTIKLKDHYTGEHVESTVQYASDIARALNLPKDDIESVKQAAILHDLGKIGISEKILLKKSKLTKREFEEIKKHPQIAADIIRPLHFLHNIIPLILYHHERWDGKGYPSGLRGEDIPIGARIISIADIYQALISQRPYRKAFPQQEAVEIIRKGSGLQFEPKIVDTFLKIVQRKK